jgi:hypothetical protein
MIIATLTILICKRIHEYFPVTLMIHLVLTAVNGFLWFGKINAASILNKRMICWKKIRLLPWVQPNTIAKPKQTELVENIFYTCDLLCFHFSIRPFISSTSPDKQLFFHWH